MLSGYEADRCRRRDVAARFCLIFRLIVRHATLQYDETPTR